MSLLDAARNLRNAVAENIAQDSEEAEALIPFIATLDAELAEFAEFAAKRGVEMHPTPRFPGFDHVAGTEAELCFACRWPSLSDVDREYIEGFAALSAGAKRKELTDVLAYDPADDEAVTPGFRTLGYRTLVEAAASLGTSPDNLRGAIKRGSLKAQKHGRDWWVSRAEVKRYRKEHRRG